MNRTIIVLFVVILMVLTLNTDGESAGLVTVRVWSFLNPSGQTGREKALKLIITDFEAANPGIKIQVESVNYQELPRQFAAAVSAKNAPDLVWTEGLDSELIQQGAVADMSKLFEAEKSDFFPDLYKGAGYGEEGKVYGMVLWPAAMDPIFYRKDLFREAGINPPLKSWDDFVIAAQKLTVDKDKDGRPDVWGFGFALGSKVTGVHPFQNALFGLQGDLYDMKSLKAKYANANGVKAMSFITDLVTKYKVTPREVTNWTAEEKYEQFSGGRFAMIDGYGPRVPMVQSKASGWNPLELGVMRWPSPKGDKPSVSFVGGWQVAMWNGSRNKSEAGKFVQALFSKSAAEQWLKVGNQLPVRVSMLKDPFFEVPKNAYLKELLKAIESPSYVFIWPGLNVTGSLEDLSVAAQKVILQGADVMRALKEAEDAFNKRQR